jgi:hypothetical protein
MQSKQLLMYFLLLFFCVKGYSQQFKQFTGKPETFTSEILTYVGSPGNDEQEIIYKSFALLWDSAKFTPTQKSDILNIAICFVDKKARANPDFYNLLKILNRFKSTEKPINSFDEWLNGVVNYCSNRKLTSSFFYRLINSTSLLINQNILYQSPSVVWKVDKGNYSFVSDSGLFVKFVNVTISAYAKRDSILIYNTQGYYFPASAAWKGKGGLVTWERAGYSRDTVSASLSNYTINLTKSSYEADSVVFYNKMYFNYKLDGHLEDNVTYITNKATATFPKFVSYKTHFILKNLYKNVNYEGGFSMQGAKLVGSGSETEKARLDFYKNDSLRLSAFSRYFIFRPERVIGINAAVKILLDADSIYHGDLNFTYTTSKNEVSLLKSDNYSAQSPYLSSYHKVDMNFEQLKWNIDEPYMYLTLTPGASFGRAMYESVNFFNTAEFEGLQYYDEMHPLFALKKCALLYNSEKFTAEDFAVFQKKTVEAVRPILFPLSVKGFIFYNAENDEIEIKKKLYDALSSSAGRIDYDVLRFQSAVNAPLENGYIDIRNSDLKINGIPQVFVSDSQNVAIYPKEETILMKRNRSFQYDGRVNAGLFTFFGRNFFFGYDSFKIDLQKIDSIQLRVIIGYDNFQKPIYQDVQNTIEDVTGDLSIDDPNNKSGIKNFPKYPLFSSKGNSYVYYDRSFIQKGVYKRKNFFFQVDPYLLDSLDNFRKEGMEFKGELHSAGIFPVIPEKLVLQPDFSLGFKHKTPPDGFPIYGGKGQFYNTVILSNRGLRGDGKLEFITSTTISKDFLFFPDSMNTTAPDFTIGAQTGGVQYPQVNAKDVNAHWEPYADKYIVKNNSDPMEIFNKETDINGMLNLSSKGLKGAGTIDMTTALSISKDFRLGYSTIDADTSAFKLRSLHSKDFTVLTDDVKAHIDFSTRTGTFHANKDKTFVEFPENKYLSYLEDFNWKMDKKQLEMLSRQNNKPSGEGAKYGFKDNDLVGAKYVSTKYGQDSLCFISPKAIYDYDKNVINAQMVKYIEVADARIIPYNENVVIEANAVMKTLEKAKIIANTETRFHNFYDGRISITGKYNYTGIAKYDYIDENNKVQVITFNDISVDTSKLTLAKGSITEPDSFYLSPNYAYQGNVTLKAKDKYIHFDGSTKLELGCNTASSWIKFDTIIDPIKIFIPIGDKIRDINLKNIYLGTFITTDSIHVYSSFFSGRKNYSDTYISTASGYLYFNKDSQTYVVTTKEKIKNNNLPGNLVSFNRKRCWQHGEGNLNLGIELGQVKLSIAGSTDHDLNKNEITLRTALGIDFTLLDKALETMSNEIDSLAGKDTIDTRQRYFKKLYGNLVDSTVLIKYNEEQTADKPQKKEYPKELQHTLFFNDINFKWDDVSNSYRSNGKIGIGYIDKKVINKYVKGYIEITRKRTGDLMDIFLQIDDRTWYYIAYTRGVLHVQSSNRAFVESIMNMKPENRISKVETGQTPYNYIIATERKKSLFYARWKDYIENPKPSVPDINTEDPAEELPEGEKPEEFKEIKAE